MASKEAWVERILRVLDHIQTHLDDELDPSELAQLAEFSLHHFHRVFRGMTGESVMGLVRRLRLERAALRIKFGHQPITEVAALSGYGSHEAFTRAFRARFELAPVEFRQQRSAVELKNREVSRQTRPQRTLLTVRHTGPYEECMGSWDRLLGWAGPLGLLERSEESLGLCYDDPEITAYARKSCMQTNQPESLHHANWAVYVRKVECPEALTRVTGCKLQPQGLPEVDGLITAAQAANDPSFWKAGSNGNMYETTTMEDCCRPSCAAANWVEGKGLNPDPEYNVIYSCDRAGVPLTQP